jgi:hypothetical protein
MVAISNFFGPTVASLLATDRHKQLAIISNELGLWCGYCNLPIAITLLLGSASFLSLFGASFAVIEAQWSLQILVFSFLVYSLLGAMPTNVLAMGGQHRKNAWIEILMIPLVLILHMTVTGRLGIVGAASVTGVSLLIVGILRCIVVRREFGYWQVRGGDIWRFGSVGVVSLLCATSASYLTQGIPPVASLATILIAAGIGELLGLWWMCDPIAMRLAAEMQSLLMGRRVLVADKSKRAQE